MIHHNFILCLVLSLAGTYAFDIRRSRQISRSVNKSTLNDTNPDSITPYPQSGYRPGRAFDLPSEITTENFIETTTVEEGPYPPSGWKPKGKSFPLPNEDIDEEPSNNKPSEFYGTPKTQNPTYLPPNKDYLPSNKNNTEIDENDIEGTKENTDKTVNEIPNVLPEYGFYYIQLPNGVLQKVYYRSDRAFNGDPTETEIYLKTTTTEATVETTTDQKGSRNNTLINSKKPKSKSLPLPNDGIDKESPENKPSEFYGIPTTSNPTYSSKNKNNTKIDENNIETLENTKKPANEIPTVLPEYGFYYVQLSNGELQKVYYRTDRAFDGGSTNEVVSKTTTTETPLETKNVQDGPYPPSGWKPKGKSFPLPNEEIDDEPSNNKPNEFYGPPTTQTPIYLPPSKTYLPGNKNNTEIDANDFETIDENTDEPANDIPVVLPEYEFYYVQLPNGLLQKVFYRSDRTFYGNPISALQYQPIYQQKPVKYLAQQPRSMKLIAPQSENIEYVTQNRQFWGKF